MLYPDDTKGMVNMTNNFSEAKGTKLAFGQEMKYAALTGGYEIARNEGTGKSMVYAAPDTALYQ